MSYYKGLLKEIKLDFGAKFNSLIIKVVQLDGTVNFTINCLVQFYNQPSCLISQSTIPFNFIGLGK